MTNSTSSAPFIGPLMLDVQGLELSAGERVILAHELVGGLILFSRNYANKRQLKELIQSIREINPNILIAVDHEGGRVQRFRSEFSRIPPMNCLGQLYKTDPEAALLAARELAWLLAVELRVFDIDFSFAPVLDVDFDRSKVIGDRAFSNSGRDIVALASAFLEGFREAGMASTGKHFPGHGFVEADSHIDIPVDERAGEEILGSDAKVFAGLMQSGLDAVMPAHVIYSQVDKSPAGFSTYWLQSVLRQQMRFDGVIFSDDLTMEGASVAGSFSDRARAALDAGCDMVLVCNSPQGASEVLNFLEALSDKDVEGFRSRWEPSSRRLNRMKGAPFAMEDAELRSLQRWQDCQALLTKLSIEVA